MVDKVFEALADEYRRQLLFELLDRNPRTVVTRPESPRTQFETDDATVRKHHVHLPKLEADGFIDWDRNAQVVTKGPAFDEIRPILELIDEHQSELPGDWVESS